MKNIQEQFEWLYLMMKLWMIFYSLCYSLFLFLSIRFFHLFCIKSITLSIFQTGHLFGPSKPEKLESLLNHINSNFTD